MARFFNENEFHSFFSVLFPLKRNENETGQQENETKRNEKLRKRNGKPKRKFSNKSLKITEYQVECTSWSRSQRCPSLLISGKSSKFWSFLPFSGHNWFTYVGPSPPDKFTPMFRIETWTQKTTNLINHGSALQPVLGAAALLAAVCGRIAFQLFYSGWTSQSQLVFLTLVFSKPQLVTFHRIRTFGLRAQTF